MFWISKKNRTERSINRSRSRSRTTLFIRTHPHHHPRPHQTNAPCLQTDITVPARHCQWKIYQRLHWIDRNRCNSDSTDPFFWTIQSLLLSLRRWYTSHQIMPTVNSCQWWYQRCRRTQDNLYTKTIDGLFFKNHILRSKTNRTYGTSPEPNVKGPT